ncbi:hypothetical protein PUR28_16330 [Streptomyces sp. BE308]|uniref:hypothetical protein n=1 Tax=unclassified Streptomyces TaxID=2593676 RepID=UPI002DDC2B32|nr:MULTISPECIES: hypothetical protein [unclassified Streptomyces]MEE1792316.1 hypothetical protein [Streptomyces sp. BE308]WRZ70430.1 hypothetical protein OG251_01735 [Streptomyces sp. NBC_01237]
MFALTALLAQLTVIFIHRAKNKPRSRPDSYALCTALCLLGIAIGWLAIGRPEITWDDGPLVLISGLLITVEAADATVKLGAPRWADKAVCLLCGAAAATWMAPGWIPWA